jgi:nucleoside-triphosphatase THEP1
MLRYKKLNYGVATSMLITGESGSGKSEIAKRYVIKNPLQENEFGIKKAVIHYELKSVSTPEEFLRSILIEVGDPQMGLNARNKSELFNRLVTLLKTLRTELLIIDEVQVIIERRSEKVVTGIADLFKDLIKNTNIPIVLVGMPWSKYLVSSNPQLDRRVSQRFIIPPYRISSKIYQNDYRKLLKFLGDSYSISEYFHLEDIAVAFRCFSATNGNMGLTADLVRNAYIISDMQKKPFSIQSLAEAIKEYGLPNGHNPFMMKIEDLSFRELIVHSDWTYGRRANRNSIIDAQYVVYGITSAYEFFRKTGAE